MHLNIQPFKKEGHSALPFKAPAIWGPWEQNPCNTKPHKYPKYEIWLIEEFALGLWAKEIQRKPGSQGETYKFRILRIELFICLICL